MTKNTFLTLTIGAIFSTTLNAAGIIYYDNKAVGKEDLTFIPSNQIYSINYEAEDQELSVNPTIGATIEFKVDSHERALEILKILTNTSDATLIELEES